MGVHKSRRAPCSTRRSNRNATLEIDEAYGNSSRCSPACVCPDTDGLCAGHCGGATSIDTPQNKDMGPVAGVKDAWGNSLVYCDYLAITNGWTGDAGMPENLAAMWRNMCALQENGPPQKRALQKQ